MKSRILSRELGWSLYICLQFGEFHPASPMKRSAPWLYKGMECRQCSCYLRQGRRQVHLPAFTCLSVCLSVCLSDCLSARLLINVCIDLDEMLHVNRCWYVDELINF